MQEQRTQKRYRTMWKVYLKRKDNDYDLIGYLTDISTGGARFFIDKPEDIFKENERTFRVLIQAEGTEVREPVEIPVELSWQKEWKNDTMLCEMGVKFSKIITNQEMDYIKSLIKSFEPDKK